MSVTNWIILALLTAVASSQPAMAQDDAIKAQAKLFREMWKREPAKPVAMTIPLYSGRVMTFMLPAGFVPVHRAEQQGSFIAEFIPDGETLETWSKMVTVASVRGVGGTAMDTDAIAETAFRQKKCGQGPIYENLGARQVEANLDARALAIGCASVGAGQYAGAKAGTGEQTFLLLMRDLNNIYTLQYAERAGAFAPGQPRVPVAQTDAILARFGKVRLCSPDPADEECKRMIVAEMIRSGKVKPGDTK